MVLQWGNKMILPELKKILFTSSFNFTTSELNHFKK